MERGRLIDGKAAAEEIKASAVRTVSALRQAGGPPPRLDAVLTAEEGSAAELYAERQRETCAALGMDYRLHAVRDSGASAEAALFDLLATLNADPAVDGVMVHMPLPAGVDEMAVKAAIDPVKDAEGVTPANIGNVIYGRGTLAPCTGLAAVELIERTGVELRGARVVVVGASDTVGKPIAALLMRRDATVVSCNQWTWGLEDLCRSADVLVSAVGKPRLITSEHVKPGAVVIDVGVTRVRGEDGKTRAVGDVWAEQVRPLASWLSPVPGGVGPVTVAVLLRNVAEIAASRRGG